MASRKTISFYRDCDSHIFLLSKSNEFYLKNAILQPAS